MTFARAMSPYCRGSHAREFRNTITALCGVMVIIGTSQSYFDPNEQGACANCVAEAKRLKL